MTKRYRPKVLSGSQKRPQAKAKKDRSRKRKGALDKYLNHPQCHHIQDGDNVGSQTGHVTPDSQSGSLCIGSDTSVFFLLLMLLRCICHQVSNQSDKFDLAIILFADVSPTYSSKLP